MTGLVPLDRVRSCAVERFAASSAAIACTRRADSANEAVRKNVVAPSLLAELPFEVRYVLGDTAPHVLIFEAQYAEAVQFFSEQFRRRCLEQNIDFVELDTAEPYDKALLHYLNKRRKLL